MGISHPCPAQVVALCARGLVPGQQKGAKFPTSKAPSSAVFHSFRLIFGRAIISRNGLEALMLFRNARARNTHVEATLNHPFAAQAGAAATSPTAARTRAPAAGPAASARPAASTTPTSAACSGPRRTSGATSTRAAAPPGIRPAAPRTAPRLAGRLRDGHGQGHGPLLRVRAPRLPLRRAVLPVAVPRALRAPRPPRLGLPGLRRKQRRADAGR